MNSEEILRKIKDKQLFNHALSSFEVQWLIEQAERAEKMEDHLRRWEAGEFMASDHYQQNKRYREAIELILAWVLESDVEMDIRLQKIHVISDKAMEGEK